MFNYKWNKYWYHNQFVENDFQKRSREHNNAFKCFEENKINKLIEELKKDFKLYTKRCEACNCKYSNEDTLKKNKVFQQNKAKYITPDIWNKFKSENSLDCIKEYINENKKLNKINCNSFKIVYRVNNNFSLSSFIIKMLDENNNEIGSINNSNKVSFKYKDKDIEEFYVIKNVNRLCTV